MDKLESKENDPGRERLKKRAAVSTDAQCPSKAALTEALSGTRYSEDIPVPRGPSDDNEDVEVVHCVSS